MVRYAKLMLVLIAVAGIIIGVELSQSNAQAASQTSSGSAAAAKRFPTFPTRSSTNKQVTPSQYVASCPTTTLPPEGIIHNTPPSTADDRFESLAIGIYQGQPYYILGGYMQSDPAQGVISIQPIPLDPCKAFTDSLHGKTDSYPLAAPSITTPFQKGSITFTAIQGNVVTYVTASGTAGAFNFVTDTFTPSAS
jgi:hypothetical protein